MRGQNKHLTKEHRFYIEKQLSKGVPVTVIAKDLGYSRQAIYAEIKRGSFEYLDSATYTTSIVYGYDVGQRVHEEHGRNKGRKKLSDIQDYLIQITELIKKKKYSPEAAQHLIGFNCSTTTIYNYIHSGIMPDMTVYDLPYAKKRKKKEDKNEKAKRPPRGKSIEQRPADVLRRNSFGHWEMDTVYSSKDDLTCLLVLSERMTRQELIFKIPNRTAKSVITALDRYERKIGSPAFRKMFKSITCDNGMEFVDWEAIERSCRTKGVRTTTYFCHPYCSSERGTNENINRMIRRWIPKGDDIGLYTTTEIAEIQDWINNYPRGIFGGLSSNEFCRLIFADAV